MKKIFSVILLAALVMSIAVVGTSAAEIYMEDDFSFQDETKWWYDGVSKYFCDEGMLQAYKDGIMHQSAYGNPDIGVERGHNRNFRSFVAEMDVRIVENDSPGSTQGIGFWISSYSADEMEASTAGEVYNVGYDHTNGCYVIGRGTLDAKAETNIIAVPTEKWQDGDGAPYHKLAIKVEANGMLSLWIDKVKVLELNTKDAAAVGGDKEVTAMGTYNTPLLIVNRNNFVQIDNLVVASPDYYSEAVTPAPDDDTTNNSTDTESNGSDTENNGTDTGSNGDNTGNNGGSTGNNAGNNGGNSKPNATDTNKNQSGSASTGDALYIAVAVAVAALGSAIVVKKVVSK